MSIDKCVCMYVFVCVRAQAKWIPMSASFVMLGQHPRATGCMQVYELDGADAKVVQEVERPVRPTPSLPASPK